MSRSLPESRAASWIRTELSPAEIEVELALLSPSEREQLEDPGFCWRPGRVLWRDPGGALRRPRFTHWSSFRTAKGAYEIDSSGRARERRDPQPDA